MTRQPVAWPPAFWTRSRAWLRQHPMVSDTVLAACLVWVAMAPLSTINGRNKVLAVALILALACPVILRRRAPAAVFLAILALALLQLLVNPTEGNDLGPLGVAFYTVTTLERHWRVLAAAAVLEAGAVIVPHAWAIYTILIAFTMLLGYYVRTRRAYIGALVDRAERLERERDQQARLTVAAERARIAREVHDIVAHNIAVMTALADGAAYTAQADPGQGAELMRQVSQTGRSALGEMRRLIGVLRDPPGHSPQPALDDIDDLLATVRAAGLPVTMAVTGQAPPLPATARLAIYRIIQEALTNTLKHAPGATALIHLDYQAGQTVLEITDSGRPAPGQAPAGAAPGQVAAMPSGGHGIAGMRERAALFAGYVTAGPVPGGGWRIRATLRPGAGAATGAGQDTGPATIGQTGAHAAANGAGHLTAEGA